MFVCNPPGRFRCASSAVPRLTCAARKASDTFETPGNNKTALLAFAAALALPALRLESAELSYRYENTTHVSLYAQQLPESNPTLLTAPAPTCGPETSNTSLPPQLGPSPNLATAPSSLLPPAHLHLRRVVDQINEPELPASSVFTQRQPRFSDDAPKAPELSDPPPPTDPESDSSTQRRRQPVDYLSEYLDLRDQIGPMEDNVDLHETTFIPSHHIFAPGYGDVASQDDDWKPLDSLRGRLKDSQNQDPPRKSVFTQRANAGEDDKPEEDSIQDEPSKQSAISPLPQDLFPSNIMPDNGGFQMYTSSPQPGPVMDVAVSPLPADFQYPPLKPLPKLDYELFVLENGLRVYLAEQHDAPLIRGSIIMPGGLFTSPTNKVGLASMSTVVQRSGGTTSMSADEINDLLEQKAASIEGGASFEATSFGFECLSADASEVLGVLSDILQHPLLPQDKVDLFRAQALAQLEHRNDVKQIVAERELRQIMYGTDSIYARQPTPASIRGLGRDDVADWLQAWQRPDNARIVIVGDFDKSVIKSTITKQLGSWKVAPGQPEQPPSVPTSPVPAYTTPGTLFFVDVPGDSQAAVVIGEPGDRLTTPDRASLDILTGLLNGFGGTLFDAVRTEDGLAYSVRAGWEAPIDYDGLFLTSGDTSRPADFIRRVQKVLTGVLEQEYPEQDVQRKKDREASQFVFNFASKSDQALRVVVYSILGLPEDYLFQTQEKIQQVTSSSVLDAARKHLHPKSQTIVVVGDGATFRPQLKQLGMPIVDITL